MKIVEVVDTWPAEVFIQRHIFALRKYGLSPIIAASNQSSLDSSASTMASTEIVNFIPKPRTVSLGDKLLLFRFILNTGVKKTIKHDLYKQVALNFFKSLEANIIHFHYAYLAIELNWIPLMLNIPYTVSIRGSDINVFPLIMDNYMSNLTHSLRMAAAVHTVSNAIWQKVLSFSEQLNSVQQKTIYTTVPVSDSYSRQFEPKEKDKLLFVTVGRFHWQKAYVQLLIAFSEFLKRSNQAILTIIGDGKQKDELIYWINELKLQDHVVLAGKLDQVQIQNIYSSADAYIQSSIAEGFSNATAEALASGLPVFATDVGGTSEIIADGKNGFLLDPLNPRQWWKKLILAKNKESMANISRAGYLTAKNIFTESIHAESFIDFYNSVILH